VNVRAIIALAVSVGTLAGCRDRQEAVAADLPKLEVRAEVARPHTAVVSAPVDGRVKEIAVREGATVQAGDVLLSLWNPTIARDLAYTRAQLALAEHRLKNAGAAPPQRKIATEDQNRLRATEELVRNRKAKLDRYEKLFASRDVSFQELEQAQAEYTMATRELSAERAAMQNVAAAPVTDPALLQLDVEKARAEAALIEDRQKQLVVSAPIAGMVMRVIAIPGDNVYPRDPLVEIANAATLDVRGAIAPELVRYVRPGMPVDVKVLTVPPRRFSANIRTITPAADAAGPTLVVPVPNPDGVLQPGTPAVITVR
jgi:multidrug resistance efflux pump